MYVRCLIVIASALLLAACGGGRSASPAAGDLAGAMDGLRVEISTASEASAETAEALAALLAAESGAEIEARFEPFGAAADAVAEHAEAVADELARVERRHEAYFEQWNASLEQYQNQVYRERSAKRRDEVEIMVAESLETVAPIPDKLELLADELADAATFIANDPTPAGIAAIEDRLQALRAELDRVQKLAEPAVGALADASGKLVPVSQP